MRPNWQIQIWNFAEFLSNNNSNHYDCFLRETLCLLLALFAILRVWRYSQIRTYQNWIDKLAMMIAVLVLGRVLVNFSSTHQWLSQAILLLAKYYQDTSETLPRH